MFCLIRRPKVSVTTITHFAKMVNVRTAFILYIFPNKPGSICRFADQEANRWYGTRDRSAGTTLWRGFVAGKNALCSGLYLSGGGEYGRALTFHFAILTVLVKAVILTAKVNRPCRADGLVEMTTCTAWLDKPTVWAEILSRRFLFCPPGKISFRLLFIQQKGWFLCGIVG